MSEGRLFKVVGVSRLNGEVKVRFGTDIMYVKGLAKAGNTDIELLEYPGGAATKPVLVEWLKTTELYQNLEYKEAIDNRAELYVPRTKTVRVRKAKDKTPSLEDIKSRIPRSDDSVAEVETVAAAEQVAEAAE